MGNRGNVVFIDDESGGTGGISPAVYLHWNGGPESVYAFLAEMDYRKIRHEAGYEAARFCQIVGEFFDQDQYGTLSLGVNNGPTEITPEAIGKVWTDNGDNGFYVIERTPIGTKVRRFAGNSNEEMSNEEVDAERVEAFKTGYIEEVAAVFRKSGKTPDGRG